jgi:hypothetical protein
MVSGGHCAHMLRALLLIFDPANSWEKIETAKPSVAHVFFTYVLPIMLLSFAVEAWLLTQLGTQRGRVVERVAQVSKDVIIRYEVTQFVLGIVLVFLGAFLMQKLSQGFHRRHTYGECFATLSYSLGPYFLCRMLDGWPPLNTWIVWATGALLAVSLLYRGLPRVMKPDPSNALGVYLMCSILILVLTGVAHYFATLVLSERIFRGGFSLAGG